MNRPHLGVFGSEPVRTGMLPLSGAELGEASACGKRLSAQPAPGPTLAAEDMRWRAGEYMRKMRVPQWEWGGPWHSHCFHHTVYTPCFWLLQLPYPQAPYPCLFTWLNCSAQRPPPPGSLPWLLWALHNHCGPSSQDAMIPVHPLSSFPRLWAGVASFAS